ncbi:MAG: aminotransferase class I/II-fold pyridoxal phosphate-dependent enzyme [Ruminococcaceae bacterium]|nr:aminotransferase class I/II-fold pyridoxal phosphate-dependent enzyme [Oscillospiraceae bacterium]
MYRIGKEEIEAVRKVIESKQLFKVNNGDLQETMNAEKELCEKLGARHALVMTSGHAAIASAIIALGIGPGDQVIIPAYTYIATAIAVLEAGAIPVIAEIDETFTIDPEDVKKKITKYTKAIIPVHIKGFPSNMEKICAIAKEHGIAVVEDSCQADGASFKGKRLGTWGDAGAYSFNYFKIISMGEGGALVTDRRDVFENALIYHDSSACAYFGNQMQDFTAVPFCGSEYRTNEIASAILREQLKKLDVIITDLRKNKKYLMDNLAPFCNFIKSNDIDGDLGTTVGILFDTVDAAEKFGEAYGVMPTIHTKKHVYSDWKPILEKRGALNPLMDPFKMEANKDIIPDYKPDMCPRAIDLLSRVVYVEVNPDWTKEEMNAKIDAVKAALKA